VAHRLLQRIVAYILIPAFGDVLPASSASAAVIASHRAASHTSRGWMARDANPAHPWPYVASFAGNFSDPKNSVVSIYDIGKVGFPNIGSITQGLDRPVGIVLDPGGTLYVTNITDGTVTIYPLGAVQPSLTLSDGLLNPSDCGRCER
jgi:DNA-binding beta-propeller fold protein YncE